MGGRILFWIVLTGLVACTSRQHGVAPAQWNELTREEREAITQQMESMLEEDCEQQREKEFLNREAYERDGIPLNGETLRDIWAAADEVGVDVREYGWLRS